MDDKPADPSQERDVVLCAIGCSAGGIAALQKLLGDLPSDLGLAYAIMLHLAPDQPSLLHEVLASCTAMPVIQIAGSEAIRADHVYVVAPGCDLFVEGELLEARPFPAEGPTRTPIDTFLRSLAGERGDGIAVILTGAGQDGTRGVRAVKEAGGIVLIQDAHDAEYPSMPESAAAGTAADFVGSIAAIAGKIVDIARSRRSMRDLDGDAAADGLRKILALTQVRTGYDFSGYKRATVLRRIKRRMQLSRHTSLESYGEQVRRDPGECDLLFADLLISVTAFFRDAASFEVLQRNVVRRLVKAAEDELRVWVVGCASGEEAYSIAMLFNEEIAKRQVGIRVQLFATDLDDDALAIARAGAYPRSIEADVSPERLRRHFVDESSHYRIRPALRDMVLFTKHSAVRDPPFTRLDLVVCRNVLIYFERQLQQQVAAVFHYALQPQGFLFLGPAEVADPATGMFEVVDREHRIYRVGSRPMANLPVLQKPLHDYDFLRADRRRPAARPVPVAQMLGTAHLAALEENAPPSILVDATRRVLNLSARAGRFLLMPGGPIADSLPAIVRPELQGELLMALDRAFAGTAPVVTRAVEVGFDDERRRIILYAAPIPAVEGAAVRVLVCFLDAGKVGDAAPAEAADGSQQEEMLRLRIDLGAAQQALLTSRAEHEASMQDLRVANEELHSLNEEYRSTAEELETSKEELQSVNEELQTVNHELRSKVQLISRAHNDLLNLTRSTEIGTLFLDVDLNIRMMTPPIGDLFRVSEIDVGRNITDFAHKLIYNDLEADVREVLFGLKPVEREIRGANNRWLLLRIRPYLTMDDKVNGVVLTFNDVTTHRQEVALNESEARFRIFVEATADVVYRMSADWRALLALEGRGVLAAISEPSKSWLETYILAKDRDYIQALIDDAIRGRKVFEAEHRVRLKDGTLGWTRSRAVPILDSAGEITEWLGTAVDITAQRAGDVGSGDEAAG